MHTLTLTLMITLALTHSRGLPEIIQIKRTAVVKASEQCQRNRTRLHPKGTVSCQVAHLTLALAPSRPRLPRRRQQSCIPKPDHKEDEVGDLG